MGMNAAGDQERMGAIGLRAGDIGTDRIADGEDARGRGVSGQAALPQAGAGPCRKPGDAACRYTTTSPPIAS